MGEVEDKEKAEKVAAARKRYEQLKKSKAKKGGADKKKATKDDEAEAKATIPAAVEEDGGDEDVKDEAEDEIEIDEEAKPSIGEEARAVEQAISETGQEGGGKAGNGAGIEESGDNVGGQAGEIYRKQKSRIGQLEKENSSLKNEIEGARTKLEKVETEVEELRDGHVEIVDLKSKAAKADEGQTEIEQLKAEVISLQRENSLLTKEKRKGSVSASKDNSEDLKAQVASKTSTVESLELEISNLRHSISIGESQQAELNTRIGALEDQLKIAEQAATDAKEDAASLRAAQEENRRPTTGDSETGADDPAERIKELKSSLQTAQRSASDATSRANTMEKKIEALSSLHRESERRVLEQTKMRSKELERLRSETNNMRKKLAGVSNENARLRSNTITSVSSTNMDGIPEGDSANLSVRVHELESEIFDLKRGVWREKRKELQGEGLDGDDGGASFEEVDLDAPQRELHRSISSPYGAFSSVISAITGNGPHTRGIGSSNAQPQYYHTHHQSKPSVGRFNGDDDEFEFDEKAFQAAQEDEAKKRLERVREVKRSLNDWKGYRVDLVDLRGGNMAGVFDV